MQPDLCYHRKYDFYNEKDNFDMQENNKEKRGYDFSLYLQDLKNRVSKKRFIHSMNVSKAAGMLAEIYGASVQKAKLAGLMHDIAKEMTHEEHLEILKDAPEIMKELENISVKLWHGPVGSLYLKQTYGINDEDILNSIFYHTTGRKNMSLLEKIIFVADHISEERKWPDVTYLRGLSKVDLEGAMLAKLVTSMKRCLSTKMEINKNTFETYNQIVSEKNKKEV